MKEQMARGESKAKPETASRPSSARVDLRTQPKAAARPPAGPVSEPVRLAAEMARLKDELAALRAKVAELEASAERDPLTDLLNRRGLARELGRAIAYLGRYPSRAALVYLDLERFKPVNDRHGHSAGDLMLQAVARTLSRQVRASDSVARLGGDEFAVLLWNLNEAEARAKAQVLEAEIARTTVVWNGLALSVEASAGVAPLLPADTAAEAIARADAAMYARKRARLR